MKKLKVLNDRKGFGIGSFLIGLLLFGLVTQMVVLTATDMRNEYNSNLNLSRIERYDISNQSLTLVNDFTQTTLGKDADLTLNFINLPIFVWSSLKTLVKSVLSGPFIFQSIIVSMTEDLGLPSYVAEIILPIIMVSLLLVALGSVLRSELVN